MQASIPAGTAFKPHLNLRMLRVGEPVPVREETAAVEEELERGLAAAEEESVEAAGSDA